MLGTVLLFAIGCAGDKDAGDDCPIGDQVVLVDLDGTLTPDVDDLGGLFLDPPVDPPLREGAATLMRGYRDRGVRAVYMTVQGEGVVTGDGESLVVAISGWLRRAGVPYLVDDVLLAPDFGANRPEDERAFKEEALARAGEKGTVAWAYGDTELDAEVLAEVPQAFVIGENLPEDQAFAAHADAHLAGVPDGCAP
jgi:hypothetical protein